MGLSTIRMCGLKGNDLVTHFSCFGLIVRQGLQYKKGTHVYPTHCLVKGEDSIEPRMPYDFNTRLELVCIFYWLCFVEGDLAMVSKMSQKFGSNQNQPHM